MCYLVAVIITKTKIIWQKAESPGLVYPTYRLYAPGGDTKLTVWLKYMQLHVTAGVRALNLYSVKSGTSI